MDGIEEIKMTEDKSEDKTEDKTGDKTRRRQDEDKTDTRCQTKRDNTSSKMEHNICCHHVGQMLSICDMSESLTGSC